MTFQSTATHASPSPPPSGRQDPLRRACMDGFAEYARSRDPELRNRLVLENERLVHYLAGKFRPVGSVGPEDLVQVGLLGLIAAVERYDPRFGVDFAAFAAPTIVGMVKHCLRDQSWGVKVPRRTRELAVRLRMLRDSTEQRLGHPPTPAEMAEVAGVDEEAILAAMAADAAYYPCSVDGYAGRDEGEAGEALQEVLGAAEPLYTRVLEREAVRAMLAELDPRHQRVIEGRFFHDQTQAEVAAELGISQMHVSRLERQALSRLRELLETEWSHR